MKLIVYVYANLPTSTNKTMLFELTDKVALVTGGASGLGLAYTKELLRNGCKGVTVADVDVKLGFNALEILTKEFGADKVTFVECDVTNREQFESAFDKTIQQFNNIDILINNAGTMHDGQWEKSIELNVNGTIHGNILAMDKYMPMHKSGSDALIVNVSSVAGLAGYGSNPVYCATKHAVIGMVKSWGDEELYEKSKVRVVGICPGLTETPLVVDVGSRTFGGKYKEWIEKRIGGIPMQKPDFVAEELIKIIKHAPNGTIWVVQEGHPAFEFVVPVIETMKNNLICC